MSENPHCLCERSEAISVEGAGEDSTDTRTLATAPPRLPRHCVPRNDTTIVFARSTSDEAISEEGRG